MNNYDLLASGRLVSTNIFHDGTKENSPVTGFEYAYNEVMITFILGHSLFSFYFSLYKREPRKSDNITYLIQSMMYCLAYVKY